MLPDVHVTVHITLTVTYIQVHAPNMYVTLNKTHTTYTTF